MLELSEVLDLPLNCKIRFKTPEGDYEGTVLSTTRSGFIEVDSTLLPDEDYFGTLRFHHTEILKYQILDIPAVPAAVNRFDSVFFQRRNGDLFDSSDDDLDTISVSYEDEYELAEKVVKLPPGFSHLPTDFVIIDQLGGDFESAISHLKNEMVFGLSLEGEKLGRHGTLSWLCVSTSKTTFLFDAYELGCDLFNHGIRDILQDANIMKVIHDCRPVSDMFLHKYETKLVNVFDTQVADKYVETQRRGPGQVIIRSNSLNSCLRQFLNIPDEFLYHPMGRRFDYMLYYRPPNEKFLDVMIKNVIYLRSLREQLEDCMLEEFQDAVEASMRSMYAATDEELLLGAYVPERLSSDVTLKGIKTVKSNYHQPAEVKKLMESRRSTFLHNLKNYSEGKWSESHEVNETFPLSNSDDVLPSSYKSLESDGVKNSLTGSVSDQTTPIYDAKPLECSRTPRVENFIEALQYRGKDCEKFQTLLHQTFENSDVQLQTPECTNGSPKFQNVIHSPVSSVPDETAQNDNIQLQQCLQSNVSDQSTPNYDVKPLECLRSPRVENFIKALQFRGKDYTKFQTLLHQTFENSDVQLQTPECTIGSPKFQNVIHSPVSSVPDETAQNDNIQLQKCLQSSEGAFESLKFRGVKYSPDPAGSNETASGDTSFSDYSSENESVKENGFNCFSSNESCKSSYSDEMSELAFEEKDVIPCDPWERMRAEMSEDISPLETNVNSKYKFVPAGQQHY